MFYNTETKRSTKLLTFVGAITQTTRVHRQIAYKTKLKTLYINFSPTIKNNKTKPNLISLNNKQKTKNSKNKIQNYIGYVTKINININVKNKTKT